MAYNKRKSTATVGTAEIEALRQPKVTAVGAAEIEALRQQQETEALRQQQAAEALRQQQAAIQQCWMERFFKHYYKTSMTIIGDAIRYIRPINEEPALATSSAATSSSATTTMQRQGSSAGHNSHRELYSHEPYGINTDQDIGMVLKLDGSNMNVIRYSYESRPRLVHPKLAEIAISALYSFYFKNRREIMDADCLMIISLNDVNTKRVDTTALHQDGFVGHIAFKNNTYLPDVYLDRGPQINEVLMNLLQKMRDDRSSLPQYVIIVFKTVGTGLRDEKIIVTTIKSDGTYTFTTAPVAQGNAAIQVIFDNDGLHGTPKLINLELMKETFQTEFPDQSMDPQVIDLINEYNRYMLQAKSHIRHFTRRALNMLDERGKILALQAKQKALKARMKAEAAITIIDGVINIRHPDVITNLKANLDANFPNWEAYGNLDRFNLLQRLSNVEESTPVNMYTEEIPWPPNFFLIQPSLIPDGSERIEMTADQVEALTVYTEETVDYRQYTAEVQLMMSLKDRNEIIRFDLPDSSGCQGSKGGSRSKTRSKSRKKRNQQRKTKKRQNKKGRRTNKRKQNKRRSKKRQ